MAPFKWSNSSLVPVGLVAIMGLCFSAASCSSRVVTPTNRSQGHVPEEHRSAEPPLTSQGGKSSTLPQLSTSRVGTSRSEPSSPSDVPSTTLVDPQASAPAWNMTYSSRGQLLFSAEGATEAIPLPSAFSSAGAPSNDQYDAAAYNVMIIGIRNDYAVGLSFGTESAACDQLTNLYFTEPGPNLKGSVTFGFVLAHSVTWLSLPVGATDSAITVDKRYQLTMSRKTSTEWMVSIGPAHLGVSVWPYFSAGTLEILTSSALPPWQSVTFKLQASDSNGSVDGSIELTRAD